MKLLVLMLASAIAGYANAGKLAEKTLCNASEKAIFQCVVKSKLLSLCASKDIGPSNGTLQYRFGAPGKVELQYPEVPQSAKGHFYLSNQMYSGGGETHVRFKNGDYEYVMFDSTTRTGFNGHNNPKFSAGLATKHAGKVVVRECSNNASIFAEAYESIPREEFEDIEK
jgi:hypothetical protein